jgi:hypothetical protein
MTTEKTYKVCFTYTEGGYFHIKAKSASSAEKKLNNLLDDKGLEGVNYNLDCTYREFDTFDAEEVD